MRKVTTTPTTIPAIFPVAFVAFLVVVVGIRTFDDPVPVYEGLYVLADPPEGGGEGGGGDGDGGFAAEELEKDTSIDKISQSSDQLLHLNRKQAREGV